MNEDLSSYALGFLKAGVQYRLALSLTMEKMGISEDDFYYDLVKTAVTRMTDILEMPLYGEGSVQQLAAEYNIEIPDSDYINGWDLATDLVAAHYAGEESKTLDSPEVAILLRTVALILKDVPSTVNDEVLLKSANDPALKDRHRLDIGRSFTLDREGVRRGYAWQVFYSCPHFTDTL